MQGDHSGGNVDGRGRQAVRGQPVPDPEPCPPLVDADLPHAEIPITSHRQRVSIARTGPVAPRSRLARSWPWLWCGRTPARERRSPLPVVLPEVGARTSRTRALDQVSPLRSRRLDAYHTIP